MVQYLTVAVVRLQLGLLDNSGGNTNHLASKLPFGSR